MLLPEFSGPVLSLVRGALVVLSVVTLIAVFHREHRDRWWSKVASLVCATSTFLYAACAVWMR